MINITILVSNIFLGGGVQRVVTMLSNKIGDLDKYNITILSMFKTDDFPYFNLDEKIQVKNIYNNPFNLKKGYIKAVVGLKRYFDENEVDIFIFAGMGYGSIVKLAIGKKHKMKVIGWEHQSFFVGKKFGLEWIGKRVAAAYMDAIVVLTKADLKYYKSNLKIKNNIVQIYNPVDDQLQSNEYKADSKKIMSCGSLVYQKGFDYAVEVAKLIFENHPDWQWHVYGEGMERSLLEEKIKDNNLENNFILKGYCDNLYEKYKEYSIYVMTSRSEGFGMVLVEAQFNRLPVISFDCQFGPNEIVSDNINGYLIPCYDLKEMSNKIIDLIENKEKAIKFSRESALNLNKFDIKKIILEWDMLFDSILLED